MKIYSTLIFLAFVGCSSRRSPYSAAERASNPYVQAWQGNAQEALPSTPMEFFARHHGLWLKRMTARMQAQALLVGSWWMDLAEAETRGLLTAQQQSLQDYEAGACVESYAQAMQKNQAQTPLNPFVANQFTSSTALRVYLELSCRNWAERHNLERDPKEKQALSLALKHNPLMKHRILSLAVQEGDTLLRAHRMLLER